MSADSEPTSLETPQVQHEAIAASSIISFVVFLLIGLSALTLLATYWFNRVADQITIEHAAEANYPNLANLRNAGRDQLNRTESLDNGAFRIPIEQAIVALTEEFPDDIRISEEMQP